MITYLFRLNIQKAEQKMDGYLCNNLESLETKQNKSHFVW